MLTCMSKKDLYNKAKNDDVEIVGDHIEIDRDHPGTVGEPVAASASSPLPTISIGGSSSLVAGSSSRTGEVRGERRRPSLHETHRRLGGPIN